MLIKGAILIIVGATPILAWNWYCARSKIQPSPPVWLGLGLMILWIFVIFGSLYLGISVADNLYGSDKSYSAIVRLAFALGFIAALPRLINALSDYIQRRHDLLRKEEKRFTASSGVISVYSMDMSQKTIDEGPIDKKGALKIARQRIVNYKDFYEDSDQALVDGYFGFSRSRNNFLEISIIDRNWGSYLWYEGEEDKNFLFWKTRGFSRYEIKKAPQETVLDCIANFFDLSPDEFLRFFKNSGAKKDR